MDKVTQNSHETKAIRRRMEEVRRDLDEGVQEIVEGARDMRDWRAYVRTYPWVCVGATMAVGYMLVRQRRVAMRPDADLLAELAKQSRLAATPDSPPKSGKSARLLAFVGTLVVRGVASYVGQQAREFLTPRAVESPQDDPR